MWEMMNGMANGMRNRMPRRNGMGTMTAMIVGASVGIAAWETLRRSRANPGSTAVSLAQEVMERLDD